TAGCGRGVARRNIELHAHVGDAADAAHGRFRVARDLLSGVRVLGLELDGERDVAAVDLDVLDETERHDVARQAGKLHALQRLENLLLGGHSLPSPCEILSPQSLWKSLDRV